MPGKTPVERFRKVRIGLPILSCNRRSLDGGRALRHATCDMPDLRVRQDYKAPDYVVHEVRLVIKIFEESAQVRACPAGWTRLHRQGGDMLAWQILSTLHVKRAASAPADAALILDAEELDLASVSVDGDVLPADGFVFDKDQDLLSIMGPLPAEFKLECDVCIKPHLNTQLSGLYKSSGVYCTQCEAEGFRRITPMQDRPDVMARLPLSTSDLHLLCYRPNPASSPTDS